MLRLCFAVVAGVFLCTAVAHAGPESLATAPKGPIERCALARAVVDSFMTPESSPMGVDWVESRGVIYHVDENFGNVYTVTPEGDATLLFNMGVQIGIGEVQGIGNGLCFVSGRGRVGDCLYITDYNGYADPFNDMVYKFRTDGMFLDSWNIQSICDQVLGICYDGTYFYLSSYTTSEIVKCDSEFNEVARYAAPGTAGGLEYDPELGCFYMTDYPSGSIFVISTPPAMSMLDWFVGPRIYSCGVAIARTTRGRTLWYSTASGMRIYEIDDDYYNTPVEGTTWGATKALYRD